MINAGLGPTQKVPEDLNVRELVSHDDMAAKEAPVNVSI